MSEEAKQRQRFLEFERMRTEIEAELMRFWTPHYGQVPVMKALFRDMLRYVFLQCGRKFGKTEFVIFCLYMWAITFPDSQIYYIADTMKHAGELVWKNGRLPFFFLKPKRWPNETIEQFQKRRELGKVLHEKYVDKPNESEMRLKFKNGSYIKVDGAENYANADGIEPDLMAYDEFKSHDPRFHEAMEPNLRVKKAPLLIVGTPPEEPNTYYEKISNVFKRVSYGQWFKRPSFMNPMLYPLGKNDPEFLEECEKYIARGDEDVMERELFAEIVVSGSRAIFPVLELPEFNYEEDKYVGYSSHIRPHDELLSQIQKRPKDYEFHAVYDAGSVTCFAVLIAVVNKHTKEVFLMDEVYETDQRYTSTRNIYPRAQEKCRAVYDYEPYWEETYDNAAAWFANEVLDLYGKAMMPCTKDLNNKENKLSQIKDLLVHKKLFISERCQKLVWEMVNYRKDDKGKIPKENDHLIDCLRYFLNACHYDFTEVEKIKVIDDMTRGKALTYDREMDDYNTTEHDYGQLHLREEYED